MKFVDFEVSKGCKMAEIADVCAADVESLLRIYDHYVKNTAITFEYDTPTLEEFSSRIQKITKRYPYIVAKEEGEVKGYAYASTFIDRAAYDWSCEVTIYLDRDARGHGLGRRLYEELEKRLQEGGILNLYACIAVPEKNDEYLTDNSACFHEHLGFIKVGEFHRCGKKFDRWYNMIWMEKMIGEHK